MKEWMNHTMCAPCYDAQFPDRIAFRVTGADEEPCCRCGKPTAEEIYLRARFDYYQCQGACNP